jgi:hypothetical protein
MVYGASEIQNATPIVVIYNTKPTVGLAKYYNKP